MNETEVIVPLIWSDPQTAEAPPVDELQVVELAWPLSPTNVPSGDTRMFVPLSFVIVTPAAISASESVISDHDLPLLVPPQPAKEKTGSFTG